MYLDDYSCTWEAVHILLKDDKDENSESLTFQRPQQMWNNVLGQWETYCPAKANKAFQLAIGDDVNIEGYNEDDRIARVTFTRSDGYQIAIIKFLMEGK